MQVGKVLQAQGQNEAALNSLWRAVALQPNLAEAQAAIGEVYINQEDYLRAIVAYRRLLEITPNNPTAYYQLGVALKGRDRPQEAKEAFNRARDLFRQANDAEGLQKAESALDGLN